LLLGYLSSIFEIKYLLPLRDIWNALYVLLCFRLGKSFFTFNSISNKLLEMTFWVLFQLAKAPAAAAGKIGESHKLPDIPTGDDLEEQLARLRST
jgi:hypothetical protein